MEIEELTKMQIILLTLLVSFVTSIATGIVTVSLLDQAPPAVTQTINRIVERTVERVVPGESQGAIITKTIVVKENDIITDSIEKNSKHLVRISRKVIGGENETFVGIGIIVSEGGLVSTDSSLILGDYDYFASLSHGGVYPMEIVLNAKATALLKIVQDEDETISFKTVTFSSDLSVLKLGQTIISLGGKNRTNVAIGIVSGLLEKNITVEVEGENAEPATITILSFIETNISEVSVLSGSPLIDIFGEVIGISTISSRDGGGADYTPISVVEAQLVEYLEGLSAEKE
ncbi:hypothetical protein IIB50_00140 [Patescibacteria group bacterium]|nr:hypothetical protein [Patescibacteria group bacterium]